MDNQNKTKKKTQIIKTSPHTGLVIENKDDAILEVEALQNEVNKINALKNQIKKDHDISDSDKQLVVNTDYFYKLYKGKWDAIKDLKGNTCKLLLYIIYNTDHRDNSFTINGKSPTNDTIVSSTGLSINTIKKGISELKKQNIIATVNKGSFRVIYINPTILEDAKTEKGIHKLFNSKDESEP